MFDNNKVSLPQNHDCNLGWQVEDNIHLRFINRISIPAVTEKRIKLIHHYHFRTSTNTSQITGITNATYVQLVKTANGTGTPCAHFYSVANGGRNWCVSTNHRVERQGQNMELWEQSRRGQTNRNYLETIFNYQYNVK